MEEERIYRLKNGKEMVLLAHTKYEGIRYLLLGNEQDDEIEVATEEDKKLIIIDKQNPYFSDILILLMKSFRDSMNE